MPCALVQKKMFTLVMFVAVAATFVCLVASQVRAATRPSEQHSEKTTTAGESTGENHRISHGALSMYKLQYA